MMELQTAAIRNELDKLFSKKKTMVFLGITAIIPFIAAIIVSIFKSSVGIVPVSASSFPVFVLGLFTGIVLPLLLVMAVVDSFSGELGGRTLKISLLRPVSRLKIYISKIAAAAIYTAVILGIVFIMSIVSGVFIAGGTGVFHGILPSLAAYCLAIVPMLAVSIAVAFVAQFFKSSSGAFVIIILIYIAFSVISVLFPGISKILLTSYTNWHLLWVGGQVSAAAIFRAFMFMMSYSIIFFAAGFYIFDRREL